MRIFATKLLSLTVMIVLFLTVISCKKDDKSLPPFINLGNESLTVAKEGGNATLTIESNSDWSVEIPAEASWIAANPIASTNNTTITFTLLPNTGLARQTDVKIKIDRKSVC